MIFPLGYASIALLLTGASARPHSIFQELHVNGVSQGHVIGIRAPYYNYPTTNVSAKDIICNGVTHAWNLPLPDKVIPVPAGAQVTTEWHASIYGANDPKWANAEPIGADHRGPILAYLAKIPDALQENIEGLDWFKVYQEGFDNKEGLWATEKLMRDKGKVSFKIPECIEPGQYLLRAEIIALHGAGKLNGAQFFLSCAQLEIKGEGKVVPAAIAKFPGAYDATDRGIRVSIKSTGPNPTDLKYYPPGPPVFTCQSPNLPWDPTTVITNPGTIPKWEQCGGYGYTGDSACIAPAECVEINGYYHQCQ
ncbi:endoglucanase II [Coprinopsis marcescibilis]|uniref:AA9 family lytic polysaccharide monooxygenase n=1 Tax=Coprinopsis marcescibilis TaxID=230819 RepID=A0A5C3KXH6_COPMA|nr:endoglucanase II [Coprinopsis marcescibilis]